jgi:hypothetical protein
LIGAETAHELYPADAAPDGSDGASGGRYRDEVLADAPLAYWRLDEAAGPNAKDETGTFPGKYQGGVTFGVLGAIKGDPSNKAVHFDGASGTIDFGDVLPFAGGANFSIEVWAKVDDYAANPRILARLTEAASTYSGYLLWVSTPPKVSFDRLNVGDGHGVHADLSATLNDCHHVVVTYDTQLLLYVDGAQVSVDTTPSAIVGDTTGRRLTLASENLESSWYTGALDEVAIYDHALKPERVNAHWAAATGP